MEQGQLQGWLRMEKVNTDYKRRRTWKIQAKVFKIVKRSRLTEETKATRVTERRSK